MERRASEPELREFERFERWQRAGEAVETAVARLVVVVRVRPLLIVPTLPEIASVLPGG